MSTLGNRDERIKHLRNKGDRKLRLSGFLDSISLISEIPILEKDVISIEDTDAIWQTIRTSDLLHQANFSVAFPFNGNEKLKEVLSSLHDELSQGKQYFTTYRFYKTCFLNIDSSFCTNKFQQLIEFDGDAFYVYDSDIQNGFRIDANEEHWEDREQSWTYELKVYGIKWIEKIYIAYSKILNNNN